MKKVVSKLKLYIFYRGNNWYPIGLKDDADAISNARCNPGTTKVTNEKGKVIFEVEKV